MVNFRKLIGREKDSAPEIDPLVDYTLDKLQVGYLVDFDMKTWQVTAVNRYDYDGLITQEWELSSGNEVRFLERAADGGQVDWTLTRRVSMGDIDGDVAGTILEEGDPPEYVSFEGSEYKAVESTSGFVHEGVGPQESEEVGEGVEFVSWSYENEGDGVMYVVQSGEREFSAYSGTYVKDYLFTEILPGGE